VGTDYSASVNSTAMVDVCYEPAQGFWSDPRCLNPSDNDAIWKVVFPQYSYAADPGCLFVSWHPGTVLLWSIGALTIIIVFSGSAVEGPSCNSQMCNPHTGAFFILMASVLWCTVYGTWHFTVARADVANVCVPAVRDPFNVPVLDSRLYNSRNKLVISHEKIVELGPLTVERMLSTCPGIRRANRVILVEMEASNEIKAAVRQEIQDLHQLLVRWFTVLVLAGLMVLPTQANVDYVSSFVTYPHLIPPTLFVLLLTYVFVT